MQEMVRLESVAKRFGPVHAVEDVSLSVRKGEVLGFLGPNGAGKTTTMRIVAGFILPSSGEASVMGHDVVKEPLASKRLVGYLPEGAPAYGDMSVIGFLRFIAAMRGFRGGEGARLIETAMTRTALDEVRHRPVETLSKGFKRRGGAGAGDPPRSAGADPRRARPTGSTPIRSTMCGSSSRAWRPTRRSSSRPTFSRRWRRSARAR